MQQVVDLQNDPQVKALNLALVSIAFDSVPDQARAAREYGVTVPMLSDADGAVSRKYGVLKWAAATGEPGHTFVLIGANGQILWVRDYGAQENGGSMYVPPPELTREITQRLKTGER